MATNGDNNAYTLREIILIIQREVKSKLSTKTKISKIECFEREMRRMDTTTSAEVIN